MFACKTVWAIIIIVRYSVAQGSLQSHLDEQKYRGEVGRMAELLLERGRTRAAAVAKEVTGREHVVIE